MILYKRFSNSSLKKQINVVLCLCFFCFILFPSSISARLLSPDHYIEQYKEGTQLEHLRLYSEARETYFTISNAILTYMTKSSDKDMNVTYLPVLISSAFRLSIVTAKDNYHNMYQLVHQIDSFQRSHKMIDDVLKLFIESRFNSKQVIEEELYIELLFSRAYNRIAWANKLLIGIPWKNYIVYPPQDILGMLQLGMLDLDKYLELQGLSSTKSGLKRRGWKERGRLNRYDTYLQHFHHKLENMTEKSLVYQTKALINSQNNKEVLATIEAKRAYHQIYKTRKLYDAKRSRTIIQRAKRNYTIDAILDKKNKAMFALFDHVVNMLDIPL